MENEVLLIERVSRVLVAKFSPQEFSKFDFLFPKIISDLEMGNDPRDHDPKTVDKGFEIPQAILLIPIVWATYSASKEIVGFFKKGNREEKITLVSRLLRESQVPENIVEKISTKIVDEVDKIQ